MPLSEATGAIISAGIQSVAAGGSALATGLGSRANRHEARRQFNESMKQHQIDQQMAYDYANMDWQRNRDAALEDWQRETEYNSAAAVAARYRAAGLNPALMMSGSSASQATMNSSQPVSPGVSSQQLLGTASMPDYSALGSSIQSIGQVAATYFDNRLRAEQVEQLQIDNQFRALDHISQITNRLADTDMKLSEKGLTDDQREKLGVEKSILENDLKFSVETFEDRKRGIKRDNNVKKWEAKKIQSEYDAQELENALTREFGRSKELASLSLTKAQVRGIASDIALAQQQIVESGVRINDMNKRREYYKHEIDTNCKVALTAAGIDTTTPAGKIALKRAAAAWYQEMTKGFLPNPVFGKGQHDFNKSMNNDLENLWYDPIFPEE